MIVRLTTIPNESKRTISTSVELELLQIVSESDIGWRGKQNILY